MNPLIGHWIIKSQVMMIIIVSYQLYLAISTEVVDEALKKVEQVASWPIQTLNIALFVLVLLVAWLYLRSTRKDLAKLQEANDAERKEYIASIKELVSHANTIIERNNVIFERIDEKLSASEGRAHERPSTRRSS